jgi:flagellar protein FliO/FliZ
MTKLNPLPRAVATATVVLAACLALPLYGVLAGVRASAAAAKGAPQTGENTPLNLSGSSSVGHTSGSGGSIVRTIVGLAIVIAVIWGLSWILKQVKAGKSGAGDSTGSGLSSIATLALGTGRSVHLVRAGNDYVLLGSAEHGVVPIHRYSEQDAREAGLLDVIDTPARPRRQLLRPPGGTGTSAAGPRGVARAAGTSSEGGHDPMRMPGRVGGVGLGSGVVDRLRELTVRR